MNLTQCIRSRRTWVRSFILVGAGLASCWALAQKIDDIPPAVKNNVAPNFMFMIDNSGSMSNIVMASPYSPTGDYGTCTSNIVPAGTAVAIKTVSGAPRFTYGGNTYKHSSIASGSVTKRCFDPVKTYGAALLANSGSGGNRQYGGGYLDSNYTGHFLNWYFGNYDGPATGWTDRKVLATGTVQTRIEVARASAKTVVSSLPLPPTTTASATVRVGLSTYNGSNGGDLRVKIADLNSTWATKMNTEIDKLVPSGATPLATTLADIGRYFSAGYDGNVTVKGSAVNIETFLKQDSRNSCLNGADCTLTILADRPVQQWCQRSSVFMMTDGRPTEDGKFTNNNNLRDYDGDCTGPALSSTCDKTLGLDRKKSRTYERTDSSDYMDDVAKALFDVDLRPDLTAPAGRTKTSNLTTYVIGFADPWVQSDELLRNTADQGQGKEKGKGLFIAASDGPTLVAAFQSIISDALAKDAAAAAVAVTNAQITAGSVGYASSYNSGGWYGDLEAYSLDLSTGLQKGDTVEWSARDKLQGQSAGSRKIVSFDGAAGVAFTTSNGAAFRTGTPLLTDGIINYVRGDRTGEASTYRQRNYVLGDIINAEPVVVNYAPGGATVFQAANDGMLHVIDGRVDSSAATRGQELWAYVPRLIHAKLPGLASLSFEHEFLVDGTPATAQITGAGALGRILVGGLGKGGAGYYALDITTRTAATEAAAASKVLWEFNPVNMGYSFGVPLVVNTAAGWRVVVASGYRNDAAVGGFGGDGRGHVWVLNPATGAVEKEFVTPLGFGSAVASLGLAHLGKMANVTADSVTRYVHAGDLLGNVWRIDLDAAHLSAPVRIAAVSAPGGAYQPITVPPVVGPVAGSTTRMLVYFGTGQYFSTDDVLGTASPNTFASQVQTIYGIVDDTTVAAPAMPNIRGTNGSTCPTGGGNGELVCQTVTASAGAPFTATHNPADMSTKRGFYVDIPISSGRVNTQAGLTAKGTLVVVINQPSNVLCEPGGSSYFFQLSAATGGAILRTTGGSDYFDAGSMLTAALSSRPVLIITSTGTRGVFRLSDKTTLSKPIDETANTAALFKRIYKRALN